MKNRQLFEGVYKIASRIPKGKVATYGQIAFLLGKPCAARMVGQAMANTPDYSDIPAHRVVNKAGAMAPGYAFGGAGEQRELLEKEGVAFKENGCIDMKKHLWITAEARWDACAESLDMTSAEVQKESLLPADAYGLNDPGRSD